MSAPFEPFRVDFDPPITSGGEVLECAIIYDAASTEFSDEREP